VKDPLSGGSLNVRTYTGDPSANETVTNLGTALVNSPHRYRIDWQAAQVVYSVDGVQVAVHPVAITGMMRPVAASDYNAFSGRIVIDWIHVSPYAPATGTFPSEAEYRRARAAADRNDLPAALALSEDALSRAGKLEDQWVWSLRILKGELLLRKGRMDEGLRIVKPELPARFRNSEAAGRRLLVLGMIQQDRKLKLASLEKARVFAAEHQPQLLPAALFSLAGACTCKEAPGYLRQAMHLAEKGGDRITAANIRATQALNDTREERYAEAIDLGTKALADYRRMNAPRRAIAPTGNLGWAYQALGDFETAKELFVQAEALAASNGDADRVVWLNQLGNAAFAEHRFDDALRYYTQALENGRPSNHPELAAILTNLARTNLELAQFDVARKYVQEALTSTKDAEQQLSTRIIDARIDAASGNPGNAEKTLLDVVAKAKATTKWTAGIYLAQLLAGLHRDSAAEAMFNTAIATARKARQAITEPELRFTFYNLSRDLFESYVSFLIGKGRVEDALMATELIRAQTLEEGLAATATTPDRARLDLRRIAAQRHATLLCYWIARERSYVWTVTGTGVTYAVLPEGARINSAVEAYANELLTPHVALSHGQELYRMLIEPAVRALPKNARVIIVPDGKLYALNFETLVVPGSSRYWIEDVVLSASASLQLLAQTRARRTGSSMLLVGDPSVVDPLFQKLPRAGDEIAAIARHFKQRVVLSGPKATPAAYRTSDPGNFDFVHFVAHAVASRKRPLDSAVILGPDSPSRKYKLLARDVIKQTLNARLVTVSSCQSAGKRTFEGEGLVGLAWAFLRAGAGEVVGSLWDVRDNVTPELMAGMYAGIVKGQEPAVALREAKLLLVRGNNPSFRTPRYWAPFVLYSGS